LTALYSVVLMAVIRVKRTGETGREREKYETEQGEQWVIRRPGGNDSTKTDGERKMGFDCLVLTRPGEGVYIRKCSRDKYSTCNVSRGGKGRKTNVMAVLPVTDPCGNDDQESGVRSKRDFTEL